MNAALWGLLSAAGLGTADFMARLSARAIGAQLAYAGVLLVGLIGSSLWMLFFSEEFNPSLEGNIIAALHGASVTLMCLLLYAGLARGPVAIVAPIVAAHPALVLGINVLMGTRPGALQWAAMGSIIAGGLLIARSAEEHPQLVAEGRAEMRKTLLIALAACFAYVALILTAQTAAPLIGEIQTVCVGRWVGFLLLAGVLLARGRDVRIPRAWLPFVTIQGVLDTLGYAAFIAGAKSAEPHVSMVVASTFSVFTVLLARLVLKEPVSPTQWSAITLIAIGTLVLAAPR